MKTKVKKSSIEIKRESYYRKYYIVIRENGKVRERRRYEKGFNLPLAKKYFSSNGTLYEKIIRKRLTSKKWAKKRGFYIDEISDYETGELNKKQINYQGVVEGELHNGKIIAGRSRKHDISYPKETALAEARENFHLRLSEILSEEIYDEDKGSAYARELMEDDKITIRQGYVYYEKIQTAQTNEAEA